MENFDEIEVHAKTWIKEAGEKIKQSFETKLSIETKSSANDLVTNIDKETEQYFIKKINETYPTHKIVGEEGFGDKLNKFEGVVWIIDPIDGTLNFIKQHRNFAISIAVFQDGVGQIGLIYDVVHDELYHARKDGGAFVNDTKIPPLTDTPLNEAIIGVNASWVTPNKRIDSNKLIPLVHDVRGTRSYGSAALEIAYVATGRIDAYISLRLSPWDFAGGVVIANEVGAIATTVDGEPLNYLAENSVFIAKPNIHKDILEKYITK